MNSLAIDGVCRQIHLPRAAFSHAQSLHRSHSTDDMCALLKELEGSSLSCVANIGQSSTRHISSCASHHNEHQHTLSLTHILCYCRASSPNPDMLSTSESSPVSTCPLIHCEDSRQDGTSTEIHSSTTSASIRRLVRWSDKVPAIVEFI